MPRLLYLVPGGLPKSSLLSLRCLIEELGRSESDLEIEVASLGRGDEAFAVWCSDRNIPLHVQPARSNRDPAMLLRLRRFLRRSNPDLVHVWNGGHHLSIWVTSLFSTDRVLVDQTVPDCLLPGQSSRRVFPLVREARRRLVEKTHAVIDRFEASELTAAVEAVEQDFGENRYVVPPGITRSRIPRQTDAADLFASHGLPEDVSLIATTTGFQVGGGGKDTIWAADLLRCVRDDTHILMFGDGPLRWRMERFRWQTLTEDRVHFVDESQFFDFLPSLDCFWQPSHLAGDFHSLLLCMASGVPVVCSDLPTHRKFVRDLETGMLVTPGNRGSLARKTDLLLRDHGLWERLSESARDFAAENFGIQRQVEEFENVYQKAFQRPAGATSGR